MQKGVFGVYNEFAENLHLKIIHTTNDLDSFFSPGNFFFDTNWKVKG